MVLSWDMGGIFSLTVKRGESEMADRVGKCGIATVKQPATTLITEWGVSCYSKLSFITRSVTCFMHEALVIIRCYLKRNNSRSDALFFPQISSVFLGICVKCSHMCLHRMQGIFWIMLVGLDWFCDV